jgi:hypothetical protein
MQITEILTALILILSTLHNANSTAHSGVHSVEPTLRNALAAPPLHSTF